MWRALPWSLAGHVVMLGALALFGGTVSPPRPVAHTAIRVRLGGGPPGAAARGSAGARLALPNAAPGRPRPPAPAQPQAGTRKAPVAAKKPKPGQPKEAIRPSPKGLAPDKAGQKPAPRWAGGTPGQATGPARPGGATGAGLTGSGASAGGTDQPFPFDWYLSLVEGQVSRNWIPAQLGFGNQAERACVIHFTIQANGAIAGATVQETSGLALFDREALRAVTVANPLPPLPRGFGARSLGVSFIFTLRPDQ